MSKKRLYASFSHSCAWCPVLVLGSGSSSPYPMLIRMRKPCRSMYFQCCNVLAILVHSCGFILLVPLHNLRLPLIPLTHVFDQTVPRSPGRQQVLELTGNMFGEPDPQHCVEAIGEKTQPNKLIDLISPIHQIPPTALVCKN